MAVGVSMKYTGGFRKVRWTIAHIADEALEGSTTEDPFYEFPQTPNYVARCKMPSHETQNHLLDYRSYRNFAIQWTKGESRATVYATVAYPAITWSFRCEESCPKGQKQNSAIQR
jgi:hypothetical protein